MTQRVTRWKSWLVRRNQIILSKKVVHFIVNEAFKKFATNRHLRYWSIIFQTLLISFLMNRFNVSLFLFWRESPLIQRIIKYWYGFANWIPAVLIFVYRAYHDRGLYLGLGDLLFEQCHSLINLSNRHLPALS